MTEVKLTYKFEINDSGVLSKHCYKTHEGVSTLSTTLIFNNIRATEITNIVTKAFVFIAALFGFGAYSRIKIDGEYKTFWCSLAISQDWEKIEGVERSINFFGRIPFEQLA